MKADNMFFSQIDFRITKIFVSNNYNFRLLAPILTILAYQILFRTKYRASDRGRKDFISW